MARVPLEPPGEVRADPERLRLWNEQQADPELAYERADGCEHTAVYECRRFPHSGTVFCQRPGADAGVPSP